MQFAWCAGCFSSLSVCGEVLVGAGAGCGIGGCRRSQRAAARWGLCWARTQWCAVPEGSLAGCSPACCSFLVPVLACFVSTRSVRLTLLLFCSVFRVPTSVLLSIFLCCRWCEICTYNYKLSKANSASKLDMMPAHGSAFM